MGWFSADEIVAPTSSAVETTGHQTAQTVAICALAVTAVGYLLIRAIVKFQRQHTERVAERTARLHMAAQV